MGKKLKKVLITSAVTIALLIIVLGVHIYLVTRPHIDEHTISMTRIDMSQDISAEQGAGITNWLYQQKGVDHVVCNADMNNIVFTYYPAQVNADALTQSLNSTFHYQGHRYIPDEAAMKSGCPVAPNSFAYRVVKYFQKII
jgi:hypothetical protein